jgi:hypothetical protein
MNASRNGKARHNFYNNYNTISILFYADDKEALTSNYNMIQTATHVVWNITQKLYFYNVDRDMNVNGL